MQRIYDYMKRFWCFVWHDDSLASWLVSVALAFVLVKFLIYPGLGFILDTKYPVVAVISGSMEHKIVYDNGKYVICGNRLNEKRDVDIDLFWELCGHRYRDAGINKDQFSLFRFKNGFNTGDVMVVFGVEPKNIKIGDVILFRSTRPEPIIHRAISITQEGDELRFRTKGDHNADSGPDELSISEDRIVGKAVFRIPMIGYVKILFVELLKLFGVGG